MDVFDLLLFFSHFSEVINFYKCYNCCYNIGNTIINSFKMIYRGIEFVSIHFKEKKSVCQALKGLV